MEMAYNSVGKDPSFDLHLSQNGNGQGHVEDDQAAPEGGHLGKQNTCRWLFMTSEP